MNTMVIVAALLDRLPNLFPPSNPRSRELIRVINDKLIPVKEQLSKNINIEDSINLCIQKGKNIHQQAIEIIKVSMDLENFIESYALELEAASRRRNGFLNRIFRRSSKQIIEVVNKKLDQIQQLLKQSNTCPNSNEYHTIGMAEDGLTRELIRYVDSEVIIGMKDDEEKLMEALTGETRKLNVVWIWGMPGLGKTVLARKLYEETQDYFSVRAWIFVSLVYETRDILKHILKSISSEFDTRTMENMIEDDLVLHIYKYLKGRRYLIVLDDVWSADAWFSIRMVFPDDNIGSRILITTQIREVAHKVATPGTHIHEMRLLTVDESWELLRRSTGLNDTELNQEIQRIGMNIARKCGGLPLTIIALAGILRGKPIDEWERVFRQLDGTISKSLVDVFGLSYKQLPLYLRSCLLHLGNFPDDTDIEMDTVCQLWIAEGLLSSLGMDIPNGKTMMDVGARYFYELVERSWILISDQKVAGERRFTFCKIHPAIRNFCKTKGNIEELFEDIDENHPMSSAIWHAIYLDKTEYSYYDLYGNADYLRSLHFFSTSLSERGFIRPREVPNMVKFSWLRVLYLYGVDFKNGKFPKGIEKLVHLRFLSFKECYLLELSSSVGNMLFLQTLDLRIRNECEMTIPEDVFQNLEKLKYLYLPLAYQTLNDHEKLSLVRLKELEILENFDPNLCNADDLSVLINLKELKVIKLDCYSVNRLAVLEKLFNSSSLHALQIIEGDLGKLPKIIHEITTSSLTDIILNGSQLTEDSMKILEKLPNLRILVLETESYIEKEMKCSSDGFPELKYLKLSNLSELEDWIVEDGAMPNLCTLAIENCTELQASVWLENVCYLTRLEISSMPDEFTQTIRDYYSEIGFEEINVS